MTSKLTESTEAALKIVAACGEAIRDLCTLDPMGVPSGVFYARLMAEGFSMHDYEVVIGVLKKGKLIEERNHLLIWTGPKKAEPSDDEHVSGFGACDKPNLRSVR